jgi:hypothetical protein
MNSLYAIGGFILLMFAFAAAANFRQFVHALHRLPSLWPLRSLVALTRELRFRRQMRRPYVLYVHDERPNRRIQAYGPRSYGLYARRVQQLRADHRTFAQIGRRSA